MFASLRLIELGIKPIVLERGKNVQTRRKDLRAIQQFGEVNPIQTIVSARACSTYSDGNFILVQLSEGMLINLNIFVQNGAQEEILIDAHPHIGSNKLPKVVENIRQTILNCNGEIHFDSKVTDLLIENKTVKGVVINNEKEDGCGLRIIATGHSARDIYYLLNKKGVKLEAKPFAMGVRIEHPQV